MHARHAGWLASMPEVVIAGHYDIDAKRAAKAAERFGGKVCDSPAALCDGAKAEAVFICVPPNGHGAAEEALLERRAHLFVEAPVAMDAATAKDTARGLRTRKLIGAAGYHWRYLDTVQRAREALKGQCISLVRGWWHGDMPAMPWWEQMEASGGQFFEQATHVTDLLRLLCGEVREVSALGSRGCLPERPEYTIYDSTAAVLSFKSGAVGVITATCVDSCHSRTGVELITPERVVRIDDGVLTVREAGRVTTYTPTVDPLEEQARAFIEAVTTGKKTRLRAPYADALKSLQVGLAVNNAIRSGMPTRP
jgi:myo-inositol 2-dehydrogenase/D-chiro-inositol 1-dehydrogenase